MRVAKRSLSGIIAIILSVVAALLIKVNYELNEHWLQGTLLNPMMLIAIALYLPSFGLTIYALNNRFVGLVFWSISLLIVVGIFSTNLFE
ncbi:hypothetical protein CSE16_08020 [Solibacillus sp. R5-41]|uniref:hypothetical protein n=1 Tax=Solibacillus sp. R5-41 TaxID=2048654 RepID=UPI000C1293AA|nr:hypothetical protein [Solibacillus sp. R5-41]ATP40000.1 hypothetical protein CSE16_08020 [Solibacillus sp. R5-41]